MILAAAPLAHLLADNLPIRPFSAIPCIGGAGVLAFGPSLSSFLHPGTRTKEFWTIGSGMVGMLSSSSARSLLFSSIPRPSSNQQDMDCA